MHPTIIYHLATARAAELRSQAQRDALARAARHARTHKLEHAPSRLAAAGRRLLTSLRPRGRWRGGDAGGWSGAQVLVPTSAECRLSAGGTTEPEDQPHGVVLPAPLGPRNPVTRPGLTVKLRPSTASVAPYRLVRLELVTHQCALRPRDRYVYLRLQRRQPTTNFNCSQPLERPANRPQDQIPRARRAPRLANGTDRVVTAAEE
jgi:hypothetical protein